MLSEISIRSATLDDADALARIYDYYVENTCITFETESITATDMALRVAETAPLPWLVAEIDDRVLGYAFASAWKGRCAYRFSVEATIYLRPEESGKGVGVRLYRSLIEAIRSASMHTVIGGIALPNEASIRLHEKLGFKKVGHFERVGFKHDHWIDVGYWQLIL